MTADEFPRYVSIAEARARVVDVCAARLLGAERVALAKGLGRIVRNDLAAPRDLPAFANSAMDGFAVRGSDLSQSGEQRLRIVGTRLAGSAQEYSITSGECVRIMTGAPLPSGSDSVVIKERVRVEGDEIIVASGEIAGANLRLIGEDFHAGDIAVRSGQRLSPARIGVLAAFGYSDIEVVRRPRIAVISTGDELVLPGAPRSAAQIFNSNGFSLAALVEQSGGLPVRVGVLPFRHVHDEPAALREALLESARSADMIVASGGVSAGEADFLPALLAKIGRVHFWKARMKPGMPALFGEIGDTPTFCLPGNPVSSVATFLVLVRPGLDALQAVAHDEDRRVYARLAMPIRKRHERSEFLRGKIESRNDGALWATPLAQQGSGMLRGIANADALIVIPEATHALDTGAIVELMLLPAMAPFSR